MPRNDRTFTSTDILRIINENLDQQEKQEVLDQLLLIPNKTLIEELLEELTKFLPVIGTILDIGETLSVFFNRADIRRSKDAAAFIAQRRNALQRELDELDF